MLIPVFPLDINVENRVTLYLLSRLQSISSNRAFVMRQFIITLLCFCLALFTLAQAPRLTRSQLKHATITDGRQPLSPASEVKQAKPLSLQRVLKDRSLSLNDNKFKPKRHSIQLSYSGEDSNEEKMIASVESYDFDWDSESAIAIVNDTTCALMGKCCSIRDDVDTLWYIDDFYGSFSIPMKIDPVNRTVSIRAGVELSRLVINSGGVGYSVLYAMPLSWLAGDSVYHDIRGVLYDDGSIEFADNFGFLVEKRDISNVSLSWALSPILTNLVLYQPNARHRFKTESSTLSHVTATMVIFDNNNGYNPNGSGGTVPRPINPRPDNASSIANTGSNKPITPPRCFQQNEEGTQPGQGSPGLYTRINLNIGRQDSSSLTMQQMMRDAYIYQLDDTTIMVYNLFGSDYCWNYMRLFPDSTIFIPAQPFATNSDDDVLVNCSIYHNETDTLVLGNYGFYDGGQIVWSDTYLCSNNAEDGTYSIKETYIDNSIFLDSGLNNLPQVLMGDVNHDRKVSIGDVTALINHLLSGDDSGINLDVADCNHDGKVKIGDITALINYLLSESW